MNNGKGDSLRSERKNRDRYGFRQSRLDDCMRKSCYLEFRHFLDSVRSHLQSLPNKYAAGLPAVCLEFVVVEFIVREHLNRITNHRYCRSDEDEHCGEENDCVHGLTLPLRQTYPKIKTAIESATIERGIVRQDGGYAELMARALGEWEPFYDLLRSS